MTKPARLFLALLASICLLTAGDGLAIDPAQTKVQFTLDSRLHKVHGTFQLKRSTLSFDPQSGKLSGEVVVDATTGESGNTSRDKKMHGSVLESGTYPEITFRPVSVEGKVAPEGKSQVQVHGVFAIHGTEHDIQLPVAVDAAAGQYNVAATFVVPYVKWGMKNPSMLMLRASDTVELSIHTVVRTK